MSSEQTEITERYIQEIQWSDRATEHEKALVAGNIRQFAHGVMRPLLMVRETEKKMLRADLAALREQLAAEEAGRQADADAARAQREADIQELARMRCRARHAEKELAAKDATIADQAAEIERLREVVAEVTAERDERDEAVKAKVLEIAGKEARIAELEAVVGKLPKTKDGVPVVPHANMLYYPRGGRVWHCAWDYRLSNGCWLAAFGCDEDGMVLVQIDRTYRDHESAEAALAAAEAKP